MNVLQKMLDERDDSAARTQRRQDAAKAADVWHLRHERPELRLMAFDRWARSELAERLDWGWAGAQRDRRIEQCRLHLERVVIELWRRGWMLDGKALAARIVALLDAVGAYQRAGKVRDFWPYFSASVDRYVGANAEEIQLQARSLGAQMGSILSVLKRAPEAPSLPELAAQRADEIARAKEATLREKIARQRAKNRACKADAEQSQLL